MTRINSAIPVKYLTDEMLLAEHREIKRLPNILSKAIQCNSINNMPNSFRLGAGHVKFFLNKMLFVFNRYKVIRNEFILRNFNVADYSSNFLNIDDKYMNDYTPTRDEFSLLKERITERIINSNKKYFHYYGKRISKSEACSLILDRMDPSTNGDMTWQLS